MLEPAGHIPPRLEELLLLKLAHDVGGASNVLLLDDFLALQVLLGHF